MKLNVLEPPKKPLYGDKCNGCGICCMEELCPPAKEILPRQKGPCPLLDYKDGRFECTLYTYAPEKLKRAMGLMIGVGEGCDSIVNTHDRHALFKRALAGDEMARDTIEMLMGVWRI